MATYEQYTGEYCDCGHMMSFHITQLKAWGYPEDRRIGPSCWLDECDEHQLPELLEGA
ncbi:hypothetical protein [Mycolicibacterium lacusdiani]|uniref:hypothetical protein n=1 Tax=Mycolicibacterium lacusdiani TaxID=2895283 RepID=UPI001F36A45C|nr:hypothetical protein [Mycolicibacterium lacusdiani]